MIYILIILFPQFLFENKLKYKMFSVYYHSNEVSVEELKSILDESERLLLASDLYQIEMDQDLFICSSLGEFTFFALRSRNAFAVNHLITQNIFLSESSTSENYIFRNGINNNKRTLSGVIAHETTHSLLENHLGPHRQCYSTINHQHVDFLFWTLFLGGQNHI